MRRPVSHDKGLTQFIRNAWGFSFSGPRAKGVRRVELNQRKLLSLKSWKDRAARGEAPEGAVVLVSVDLPDVKQLDEDGNVFRFVISSSNPVARTGARIK